MNILKDNAIFDKGLYERAFYHFDFQSVLEKLEAGAPRYRFFDIAKLPGGYKVKPVSSVQLYQALLQLSTLLTTADVAHLLEVGRSKEFTLRQSRQLLTHLHLDLVLALAEIKNLGQNGDPVKRTALLDYLKLEAYVSDVESKVARIVAPPAERSNLHTYNKHSVLVDLVNPEQSRYADTLNGEHVRLLRGARILRHVEITEGFDDKRLRDFLLGLNGASEAIIRCYPKALDHKVALKLRKIRRTLKEGLYVKKTATIVLDPRHTESCWHELGHWIHSSLMPEMTKRADCEVFAENFQALVLGQAPTGQESPKLFLGDAALLPA